MLWPLSFGAKKKCLFSFFITVLLCQSKCLFSWKLIYPLSVLIFVRIILERFYLITSQMRTTFTLCYKAANYSVSGLQCAMPAVQFVGVSENFYQENSLQSTLLNLGWEMLRIQYPRSAMCLLIKTLSLLRAFTFLGKFLKSRLLDICTFSLSSLVKSNILKILQGSRKFAHSDFCFFSPGLVIITATS